MFNNILLGTEIINRVIFCIIIVLYVILGTEGKISRFAGTESKCNCLDRGCDCYEEDHYLAATAKFNTVSSITVSPDGVVHVADQANYR